jgi:hypothetical protein
MSSRIPTLFPSDKHPKPLAYYSDTNQVETISTALWAILQYYPNICLRKLRRN